MISQAVAMILSLPAGYQDYKTKDVSLGALVFVIVGSTLVQLVTPFDAMSQAFAITVAIVLFALQHFNAVGKADVLVVPSILLLNPFWNAIALFFFGVVLPLIVAFIRKEKEPMLAYLFIAQAMIFVMNALSQLTLNR